jgi:murein DD-endopeptidase MepM/ murein hydrolase activator NlpD
MAAATFTLGVMGIVGLMAVGMTTPAQAVAALGTAAAAPIPAGDVLSVHADEIQAFVASPQVDNVSVARTENYSAGTLVDLAGTVGISNFSSSVFTNDPNCAIQWPFAVGVTMTYGFGMRSGSMHEGVDFTPGVGSHIQAIADGVVRISTDGGGAYGVSIVIDHVVDGGLVSSRYAHMQYGSRQVQVGDHVSVGEFIGQTGNTGRSFGAHTHVEILQNGTTPIDPLPWLRSHATC